MVDERDEADVLERGEHLRAELRARGRVAAVEGREVDDRHLGEGGVLDARRLVGRLDVRGRDVSTARLAVGRWRDINWRVAQLALEVGDRRVSLGLHDREQLALDAREDALALGEQRRGDHHGARAAEEVLEGGLARVDAAAANDGDVRPKLLPQLPHVAERDRLHGGAAEAAV